ncbi:hypothetical protein FQA39_LY08855 [Lamprigera yunnana]|nr:hypothetical protein FQA39_LY08855 [Lamprigera yunnana]
MLHNVTLFNTLLLLRIRENYKMMGNGYGTRRKSKVNIELVTLWEFEGIFLSKTVMCRGTRNNLFMLWLQVVQQFQAQNIGQLIAARQCFKTAAIPLPAKTVTLPSTPEGLNSPFLIDGHKRSEIYLQIIP